MFRGSTREAAIPHPLPFLSIAQISDLGLPGAACPGFFRLIRRKLSLTWGVQWTSLCYSSMYLIWLGPTTQRICPMRKETGLWLHSAVRKNPVAMGDHCTLQLLIILPLFSYLWVNHNPTSVWDENPPGWCQKSYASGQVCGLLLLAAGRVTSLLSSHGRNPHLLVVAGSSCQREVYSC